MAEVATRYNPVSQFESTFPRTVGSSDDARKWEAVFGPMPDRPAPSPYAEYPIEHSQLPAAYEGERVFLAEKISGLINTTGDFWTSRLLPWMRSDHIGPFTWSTWKFNQVLASRVPHEGVPRLVTTSKQTFMARPIRRGLAAEFEGDFVNHPKGQIMMARKIQGMVVSIQTTINLDVQHTILMSQNEKRTRSLKTKITRVPITDEIDMEIQNWNAVSKSPDGFILMTRRVKRHLVSAGAQTPLILLVTPETPMRWKTDTMPPREGETYAIDVNERQMDDQLLRADQTDGNFVLKDGTQVIEIRDLNITQDAPPEQLFTRQSTIGEFNSINWGSFAKSNLIDMCRSDGNAHYCSDDRSILVHDMELDVMVKITLEECIENGGSTGQGFPDMNIIKAIMSNHGNGSTFKVEDFYPDDPNLRSGPKSHRGRNAHMMLFMNRMVARVVRHIGNMDQEVTSHKTIRQIGQSLHGMANITDEDLEDATDLVSLMQELEEAPYNFDFFVELIQENANASLKLRRGVTTFVGEPITDNELATKWGYSMGIAEWKPQYHGGLKIPQPKPSISSIVPPGLASLAGLYGLAALGNDSFYNGMVGRAKRAVRLIRKLYNAWNVALKSEALDPSNRAPWYHPSDGMYTFFDNVIYMVRDPLFLAAPSGRGATVEEGTAPLRTAPTRAKIAMNYGATSTDLEDRFKELAGGAGFGTGTSVQSTIVAAFKLGNRSLPAYAEILNRLNAEGKSADDLEKFANLIVGTKTSNARLIVRGLATEVDNATLVRNVENIVGGTKSEKRKIIAAALKEGKTLEEANPDADIGVFSDGGKALFDAIEAAIEVGTAPAEADVYKVAGGAAGAARTGASFGITADAIDEGSFYRAPLVMTPGLARTLGMDNPTGYTIPLVLPSDPASGHINPYVLIGPSTGIPASFSDRPSYGSFVGSNIKNRQLDYGTVGMHHFEHLVAKHLGKSSSSTDSSRDTRRSGVFSAASSYDDGTLFSETDVIEAIASASRRGYEKIGARMPHEYKEPERETFAGYTSKTSTYDRKRPFYYLQNLGAFIPDYRNGVEDIDPKDGARTLYELDTDNMRMNISKASNISGHITRWGALAAVMTRIDHKDHWLSMIEGDVLVPCNVLLLRPHETFLADTFVLGQFGSATGGTLFNKASSMMSWDGITRRLHLNFVFYSKAMIWNPDNIALMEDAQVRRYLRGAGVTFITDFSQFTSHSNVATYDMLSVIIPIEEQRFGTRIRSLGDVMNSYVDRNLELEPMKLGSNYSSAEYVDIWMSNPDTGMSYKSFLNDSQQLAGRFIESQGALPRMLFQAHQQNYSVKKNDFSIVVHCAGHRGRNGAYEGCKEVYNRTGEYYFPRNPEYPTDVS